MRDTRSLTAIVALVLAAATAARAELTGRVLSDDGKPVAGARVHAVAESGHHRVPAVRSAEGVTDAGGRFALTPPPTTTPTGADRPQPVKLVAVADGHGVGLATAGPAVAAAVDITLPPACALTATFVGIDGAPLAGVPVRVERITSPPPDGAGAFVFGNLLTMPEDDARWIATTDAAGAVTFEDLPQGARVWLSPVGDRFAHLGWKETISLPLIPTHAAKPIVLRPAATVAGRVTRDGRPVAGVEILAAARHEEDGGNGSGSAVSGADGAYRIVRLPPGQYTIAAQLNDSPLAADVTAVARQAVQVTTGAVVDNQDVALMPGTVITGQVTDDAGGPVPDVPIGIHGPAHPRDAGGVQVTRTAADGTFRARVPPGEQYVYVMTTQIKGLVVPEVDSGRSRTVTTRDGGGPVTVDFQFKRAGPDAVVNGKVVDEAGNPVAGAVVRVEGASQHFPHTVQSDDAGAFVLSRQPGDQSMKVRARKGDLATATAVVPGKDGPLVLTVRRNALAGVRGVVRGADGNPVAGAKVMLDESFGQYGIGRDVGVTTADGTFAVPGLWADGNYSIRATADGFGQAYAPRLKLTAGQVTVLEPLVLKRLDATLAGVVIGADGEPAVDARVRVNGQRTGQA
ncbi:MAG TPA: carboxypeptidase regulatory-like domain-containing protein, partial [Tepidisphaeraceae bacterium]|nr:carboxypeptidase regulatory-like domain-containing protein [Tepidisphaeraceae bacterium]